MPTKAWADQPRLTFMASKLDDFNAAMQTKTTTTYLHILHEEYFTRFPQPNEALQKLELKVSYPEPLLNVC